MCGFREYVGRFWTERYGIFSMSAARKGPHLEVHGGHCAVVKGERDGVEGHVRGAVQRHGRLQKHNVLLARAVHLHDAPLEHLRA